MFGTSRPAGRGTLARSGFSWVELVLTMTIMIVLVGVVSIGSGPAGRGRAVEQILRTEKALRDATERYLGDTGALPREYCGWEGQAFHHLSMDSGAPGWSGPYITGPIQRGWNPSGGQIHVFDYVVSAYAGGNGFDLDADGDRDVEGSRACVLTFWDVDPEAAQGVDQELDGGSGARWADSGRVEYQQEHRRLTILLVER